MGNLPGVEKAIERNELLGNVNENTFVPFAHFTKKGRNLYDGLYVVPDSVNEEGAAKILKAFNIELD